MANQIIRRCNFGLSLQTKKNYFSKKGWNREMIEKILDKYELGK